MYARPTREYPLLHPGNKAQACRAWSEAGRDTSVCDKTGECGGGGGGGGLTPFESQVALVLSTFRQISSCDHAAEIWDASPKSF